MINPQQWADLLVTVYDSQKSEATKQDKKRRYIVANKEGDVNPKSKSKLTGDWGKLSLPKIIERSEKLITQLKENFEEKREFNTDKLREFLDLTFTISQYTEALIESRKAKRNQLPRKLIRGIAKATAYVFSVFLIGIPLVIKLRKMDADFEAENAELKKRIQKPAQEALSRLKEAQKIKRETNSPELLGKIFVELDKIERAKATVPAEILESTKQIPSVIRECMTDLPKKNHDNQEWIQKIVAGKIPDDVNTRCIDQFKIDILRDTITFYRSDKQLGISDTSPQPSDKSKAEEAKVELAVQLLQELTKEEKYWALTLQSVTCQTTVNAFFDIIGILNWQIFGDSGWKDEHNRAYALKAVFSEGAPPIHLEVMRDLEGNIAKVNVTGEGCLDIIKYETGPDGSESSVLFPKGIKGTFSYSVELDENQRPVISNVQSHLEQLIQF